MRAPVADRVWNLGEGLVNWYAIEDGGRLTLVDAGTPKDWEVAGDRLASIGRTLADVACILLTHAHADHTGFAERARAAGAASVRVHEEDAAMARGERRSKGERSMARYLLRPVAIANSWRLVRRGVLRPVPVRETIEFRDGDILDVPGRPTVVHVPGHTPGNCAFHLPDRAVLLTGDALVTDNILSSRTGPQILPGAFNERDAQAMESLARLETLHADVILPGHGEPWRGEVPDAIRLARAAGFS